MLLLQLLTSKLTWGLAAVLTVMFMWFWLQQVRHQRDEALSELAVSQQVVQMHEATIAVVETTNKSLVDQINRTAAFEEETLANVTPEDDGPIAPVLDATLDFLRERRAGDPTHPRSTP